MLYESEDNYAFINKNDLYEFEKDFEEFTESKNTLNGFWKIDKYSSKEVREFYVIFYDTYGPISIIEKALLSKKLSPALEHLATNTHIKDITKIWDARNYRYISKEEIMELFPEIYF